MSTLPVIVVTGNDGTTARGIVENVNGHTYTPLVAVEAARRALGGDIRPGFTTPASVFGESFAESIVGTRIRML